MGLFIGVGLGLIVFSLLLFLLCVYFEDNCDELLSNITGLFAFLVVTVGIISLLTGLLNLGIEGDNRETFAKLQQEYIVITQYIKSTKSDSILESTDMMNRLNKYNQTVIEKQNDMTRPLRKYWTVGANWNELTLINLEEVLNKEEK